MDSSSMNHYEQQLYSVFKTFDVDNEEALKRSSVLQLCESLQLEDRGAELVNTLFDLQNNRVTFTQFRNGLLTVLDRDPIPRQENSTRAESGASALAKVISPPHSDDDSSGREVAPKFVFGSKKYGRRSRPHRVASENLPRHRVASESRLDSVRARQRMRCKRSSSAMESRDDIIGDDDPTDLDHDQRVNRDRALELCRGLNMHGIDQSLVDRVFAASETDEITVGEFFDKLNTSLTTSIATSLDTDTTDGSSKSNSDIVPSDAVIETWRRAGVQKPMGLLVELGFGDAALRLHALERVLDDELRVNSSIPDARLLLAAYTLSRMRLESAWRFLDVARRERDKLRDDLAEANRRARLLAQDVDENHARIEAELKSSLRQMEIRQTETVRAAAMEASAERERAAAARTAMEEDAERRAETEVRLRSEITSLRERVNEYQERAMVAENRAAQAEREQTRLQEEVRRAESLGAELAAHEREAAEELEARLRDLHAERQVLRDRCDELGAALEAGAGRRGARGEPARSWRDEVDMHASDAIPDICNLSLKSFERKDSREIIDNLWTFLTNIREISVRDRNKCKLCDNTLGSLTVLQKAIQALKEQDEESIEPCNIFESVDVGMQTEGNATEDVEVHQKTLAELRRSHELEKDSLSGVVKELESSLEQMKLEYEKCEEYWTTKLEEERELFAEEQRAGDERLADLAARIADYERQFAPANALPTIDERDGLELQVNDLQDEFDAYRKAKEAELAAKTEEIRRLQRRAEGPSWREAGALRARAGRAERAAQRLHARLAAADLLVKDLYLENCRLAHAPRLP